MTQAGTIGKKSTDKSLSSMSPSRSTVFRTRVLPPFLFASALIGLWYLLTEIIPDRKKLLLPAPHEVIQDTVFDADVRAELLSGLLTTAKVALVGLAISMVLGVSAAIIMNLGHGIERAFFPWAVVLQTLPTLALVPLIGVWFGFGFQSRLIVVVMISIFPIITNSLFGLQSSDRSHHNLFKLEGASRSKILFKLELPAAVPSMFTGFRIAAGLSVIGAIVAEFFFGRGEKGLGNLVSKYRGLSAMSEMYFTVLLSSFFGVIVFWGFTYLSKVLISSWHESEEGPS